ncbi:MAG: hypothetical protein IJD06_09565, partial [Clostridia bacterium]|nr:hypothetical protein [Clostridia bacterium]
YISQKACFVRLFVLFAHSSAPIGCDLSFLKSYSGFKQKKRVIFCEKSLQTGCKVLKYCYDSGNIPVKSDLLLKEIFS